MLKKQEGIKMIHILWIIGLLEVDFNMALKYFFAVKMHVITGDNGMSDEQGGFYKSHTSSDAAMLKQLSSVLDQWNI